MDTLSVCKRDRSKDAYRKINITKTQFSPQMPSGQLHWIIADKNDCIVVESVKKA